MARRHATQISTTAAMMNAFNNHMPERMGAVLLLNPPWVLGGLVAAMRPFLSERTMSKVPPAHFVHVLYLRAVKCVQ